MSAYHEAEDKLSEETKNISRVLNSLKEEVEAIDWYNQRVDATNDDEVKKILAHNRDEEIEHAVMAIEWLRRNMPGWDEELKTYLFTEMSIVDVEEAGEKQDSNDNIDLGIGNLK
ncbi:ferritin-like domain-containing protein [Halocella sp. SP3-1]|uniref:encapsulin-associated ferritin-like protein n=1 Tax=Halocella sp. SP3-1 TaxID=2382161 RepID=UPI000F76475B|nr:ferritin-like domain-containing protein [Halocella sp. SP3-1]AZO94122.1 hypothetical protein D7D81_05670 [Halocella sp. SP3-1]